MLSGLLPGGPAAKPRTSGNGGSTGCRSTWNVLSSMASMEKLPRLSRDTPRSAALPTCAFPGVLRVEARTFAATGVTVEHLSPADQMVAD